MNTEQARTPFRIIKFKNDEKNVLNNYVKNMANSKDEDIACSYMQLQPCLVNTVLYVL